MRNNAKRIISAALVTVALLIGMAGVSAAAVSKTINYQSVMLSAGEPVTTPVTVVFTIYDTPTGGSILWTESRTVTPDAAGRVSMRLGEQTSIEDVVFNGADRWLGVQVGGDPELTPRTAMSSAPYSFRVETVDGAKGGDISGDVRLLPSSAKADAAAASSQLTLVALNGDSVVFGPADQVALRAVDNAGNERLSAMVGGSGGALLSIRGQGGGYTQHAADASSYYSSTKGFMANAKRLQIGETGLYLYDNASEEIVSLSEAATGVPQMVLTDQSAAKDATAVAQILRIGGLDAGSNKNVVWRVEDAVGNTRMEATVDNTTGDPALTFYAPSAKGSATFAKTMSIAPDGISYYDPVSGLPTLKLNNKGDISGMGQAGFGNPLPPDVKGAQDVGDTWSTVFGFGNDAQGDSSTISGGHSNTTLSELSTISGGAQNFAGTDHPDTNSSGEVIGGGYHNRSVGYHAVIGGGISNAVYADYSTVAGGSDDSVFSNYSFIGGGHQNQAGIPGVFEQYQTIGGGGGNTVTGSYATVAGGNGNAVSATSSVIGGGSANTVMKERSVVTGGWENTVDAVNSFIGGGWRNYTSNINGNNVIGGGVNDTSLAQSCVIGGGNNNYIGVTGNSAVIGGGFFNTVDTGACVISGGQYNTAYSYSVVAGGSRNAATGSYATVSGGQWNSASGQYSVVGGGGGVNDADSNTAAGQFATVPGGRMNQASGSYAFAAGFGASATHHGSFVWADGNATGVASERSNQVRFAADGGARFDDGSSWVNLYDDATDLITTSTGAHLTIGGTWTNASDRNLKEDFSDIDRAELLERIASLNIQEWSYKAEGTDVRHIGPTAQDFRAAFGLGGDDVSISTIDPAGIALAAIQELNKKTEELDSKTAEIDQLNVKVERLQQLIEQLMAERR